MYSLRLFGGFSLVGPDGEPVRDLTQRRAEAVLAVLAVAGDMGCARDRLLGLLWPESDESHARHTLNVLLHAVRQVLGPDSIFTAANTLRLNPAVVRSDVEQFRRAVTAQPLAEALGVYRGPLLDGFHVDGAPEFERWVDGERSHLGREYGEALERLAQQAESARRWVEASAWWTRAVEHDPHNTRVVIRLMRTLAAAGDRANALREAEAHRQRLLKELELPPEPELLEEIARIRNGNGESGAGASLTVPPAVPSAPGTAPAAGPLPTVLAPAPAAVTNPPRRLAWAFGAAVAVAGLAAGWWWLRRPPPPLDMNRVAVLPFQSPLGSVAMAAEAGHAQAIVTRLLQADASPTAVEPAIVSRAWSRSLGADRSRPTHAVDVRVARATGAALVLRGALDSAAGGRVLSLTLAELPRGIELARRSAAVPAGQLETVARRLLLEVLALEAGQPEHRLSELLRHDSAAVRRFLTGARRPDLDQICRSWLTEVWRADSSLVYPGLDCLHLAGLWPWRQREKWYDSAAANVWRHRETLVPEDRAFVNALVGPWFGLADDAEARIALWDVAANAAPRWWVPRAHLAVTLTDFGPMTTIPDWRSRAGYALEEALEASDWRRLPVLETAFWFGLIHGDSALARRAADAARDRARRHGAGFTVAFGGWWFTWPVQMPQLMAAANGKQLDAVWWCEDRYRPCSPALSLRALFALAVAAPAAMPAADASALRRARDIANAPPPRLIEYWFGLHWRVRGDYERWLTFRGRNYLVDPTVISESMNVLAEDAHYLRAVLYLDAPEDTLARLAAARLQRMVDGDSTPAPSPGPAGVAHCWLAQWRLARGDTTGVARAVAYLRGLAARDLAGGLDDLPTRGRWEVCPALLEALAARVTGRDALAKARALDRLLRPMPIPRRTLSDAFEGSATHDLTRAFLDNLLTARLLAEAGDTAAALAAVQRRPVAPVMLDIFEMPNEYLRLEGRLAAAMADTAAAVAAYGSYLGLRPDRPAHPAWAAEWDSVRLELAGLQRRSGENRD
jgi:DNA-binding SARP family transcriptional activator